jgi:hypothetical protein
MMLFFKAFKSFSRERKQLTPQAPVRIFFEIFAYAHSIGVFGKVGSKFVFKSFWNAPSI